MPMLRVAAVGRVRISAVAAVATWAILAVRELSWWAGAERIGAAASYRELDGIAGAINFRCWALLAAAACAAWIACRTLPATIDGQRESGGMPYPTRLWIFSGLVCLGYLGWMIFGRLTMKGPVGSYLVPDSARPSGPQLDRAVAALDGWPYLPFGPVGLACVAAVVWGHLRYLRAVRG